MWKDISPGSAAEQHVVHYIPMRMPPHSGKHATAAAHTAAGPPQHLAHLLLQAPQHKGRQRPGKGQHGKGVELEAGDHHICSSKRTGCRRRQQPTAPRSLQAGGWRAVPAAVLVAATHSLTFTCRRQRQRQRQRCGQPPQQAHPRTKDGRFGCSSEWRVR